MPYKLWSKQEEDLLKKYVKDGLSYKDIAQILNFSIASISCKCQRLHIKSNIYWTDEEVERLRNLVNQKLSYNKISQILHKSEQSVSLKCFRLKLKSKCHSIKICKNCQCQQHSSTKICINCGHKFDTKIKSFAESHLSLLREWDYEKNIINPNNICSGSNIDVYWIDNLNHSWKAPVNRRTHGKSTCPYCSGHKVLSGFNDLATTHPNLYNELVDKDIGTKISKGSEKRVEWQCSKCQNTWFMTPIDRTCNGYGCRKCNISKNENLIEDFLIEQNINYETQKTFSKCKNKKKLRFDFYLPDYNLCIEYQGEQHYPDHKKINLQIDRFSQERNRQTLLKDNIKRKFCKENNIHLLEIAYWEKKDYKSIISNLLEIIKK